MAQTLEEYYESWIDAFNRGDVEALGGLYHADAVLMPEPGHAARGLAEVKEAMSAFLAMKGTIDLKKTGVTEGPSTAIVYGDWTLRATGDDGSPISLSGKSTDVLAKQSDGSWLMILDDPWSSA
jgi:uncharacterized protein (TIGR02246 family)